MADALAQFLSITGAEESQAQYFLSAADGDIERAVIHIYIYIYLIIILYLVYMGSSDCNFHTLFC